jgi:hypothetical protein
MAMYTNSGGKGLGVQSQSNEPKRVLDYKENQSKWDKYLCFAI